MKRSLTLKHFIPLALVSVVLILASWTQDPPNFHTGAPGEFSCQTCHTTGAGNQIAGQIELSGIPDTIQPNTDYRLRILVHRSAGNALNTGFQLTILNEVGQRAGTFSDPSTGAALSTQILRDYFEHRPAATFDQDGNASWEITWTSPSDFNVFSQNFTLYAGAVLGNGDSLQTGDLALQTNKIYNFYSSYERMSYSISKTDALCNNAFDGTASLSVSKGRTPYKFLWSTGDTTQSVSGLHAGTYGYTITDAGIDTIRNTVIINQPFAVFGEIIKTDIPCNSPIDAEAIVIPSQGVEPYTYLWSNGETTKSTSFSEHGPIFVTITDANGCTYVAKNSIIRRGNFTATISDIQNASCNGGSNGSATVQGSIPHITSYFWSNGNIGATAENLSAGTYEVTLTNPEGCEARAVAEIKEPSPISVRSNLTQHPSCKDSYNGVLSIFADGGVPPYVYQWENHGTNKTIQDLIAGTYHVTVTDAFGCEKPASFTLNEPDEMEIDLDLLGESGPEMNDGKAVLFITGGTSPYTYRWSDGPAGKDRSNLKPGLYTVTVTDIKGCTKDTTLYIYPFNCDLLLNNSGVTQVLCFGDESGSVSFETSGGTSPYIFEWSDGSSDSQLVNVPDGNYSVTVTDASDCKTYGFFNIAQPPPLVRTLEITDVTNPDLVDGKVKYIISGGKAPYTIIFDVGDTLTTYNGIVTIENLYNGLFSSQIIDANGCTISELFVINITGCALALGNHIVQDVSCYGGNDGGICVNVVNATGNYLLFWDDETSANCRTELSAGFYNVHIQDDAGCQILDTLEVVQPSAISLIGVDVNQPSGGESNGSISVLATGGIPPYSYSWYLDQTLLAETTNKLDGIGQGTYKFVIKDAKDCLFESDTIRLTDPDLSAFRPDKIKLSLAPNPTDGLITINLPAIMSGEYRVLDLKNEVVHSNSFNQSKTITADLTMLKNGIYALVLMTDKQYAIEKIIILK